MTQKISVTLKSISKKTKEEGNEIKKADTKFMKGIINK